MVAPSPGFQSEAIAVSRESCRLSGGPIGCGVELSFLMRAASFGSTPKALNATASVPRHASADRHFGDSQIRCDRRDTCDRPNNDGHSRCHTCGRDV